MFPTLLALMLISAVDAAAQTVGQEPPSPVAEMSAVVPMANAQSAIPLQLDATSGATRGPLLLTLYFTVSGLHAYDAYSTTRGLARGSREANPMMRTVSGNAAALWTVKAGATALSIGISERLWRQNRRARAVAVMLATNGILAAVAARNMGVLRRQ